MSYVLFLSLTLVPIASASVTVSGKDILATSETEKVNNPATIDTIPNMNDGRPFQ